jgi:hypothetical protein
VKKKETKKIVAKVIEEEEDGVVLGLLCNGGKNDAVVLGFSEEETIDSQAPMRKNPAPASV